MKLLIAVLNDRDRIEEVLQRFLAIGVTGATIIDSEGMGHLLSQDPPAFAGLQDLVTRTRPRNVTILSVVPDQVTVDAAVAVIEEVCGPFANPGTGVAFSLPLDMARGIGLASG